MAAPLASPEDRWLRAAIASLWFCGGCYLLLGLSMVAVLWWAVGTGGTSEDAIGLVVVAPLMLLVGVGCAVANAVVALALQKRRRWGWLAAIILGALYAPSGCMPFGVIVLYAMLRPGFREQYLAASEARPR